MPPIPPWEGAHVLLVHFPVALLLFAPALVVLSLLFPRWRAGMAAAALAVMIAGTLAAFVAASAGEEAKEAAEETAAGRAAADLMEEHEEEAELVAPIFAGLTLAFAALFGVPLLRKKPLPRKADLALHALLLLLYAGGAMQISKAAHLGGLLVHGKGVHAVLAPGDGGPPAGGGEGDDDGGRRRRGR